MPTDNETRGDPPVGPTAARRAPARRPPAAGAAPTRRSLRTQLAVGAVWVGIGVALGSIASLNTLVCEREPVGARCTSVARLWGVVPLRTQTLAGVEAAEVRAVRRHGTSSEHLFTLVAGGRRHHFSAFSGRHPYRVRDAVREFLRSAEPRLVVRQPESVWALGGQQAIFWLSVGAALLGLGYALPLFAPVRRSHQRRYGVTYRW